MIAGLSSSLEGNKCLLFSRANNLTGSEVNGKGAKTRNANAINAFVNSAPRFGALFRFKIWCFKEIMPISLEVKAMDFKLSISAIPQLP